MRSARSAAVCVGLFVAGVPSFAQFQNNTEKQLTCQNGGYDSQRARHCEIREINAPAIGKLNVDSTPNGSMTIKGWLQSGVLVRARVDASGDTEGAAAALASRVLIDTSGGQVRASGPEEPGNHGWSVSYEVFVPQTTDVEVKTHNGSIAISDVRGLIHFEGINGSVRLKRVAGEIKGATVNGSVQVELAGTMFDGRQMDLTTQNGSVTITMPPSYSAHVQAETGMGGIQSDFPVGVQANARPKKIDFNIGAGGPLIHVTTGNGSVRFKRTDTQ